MDTRTVGLQLIFVPPENWMLDETLSPAGIRIKIENGVVFFKSAGAGMTSDVVEVDFHRKTWRVTLSVDHPLTDRLMTKLIRLGLSKHSTYFTLHSAQRGWHGISLRPSAARPDRPYVRARLMIDKPASQALLVPNKPVSAALSHTHTVRHESHGKSSTGTRP